MENSLSSVSVARYVQRSVAFMNARQRLSEMRENSTWEITRCHGRRIRSQLTDELLMRPNVRSAFECVFSLSRRPGTRCENCDREFIAGCFILARQHNSILLSYGGGKLINSN